MMASRMSVDTNLSSLVEVSNYAPEQGTWYCDQLERGKVLFFSRLPFDFPEDDLKFLLAQRQTGSPFHKNISYRPTSDVLKGVSGSGEGRERLHRIMRSFSHEVTAFISKFLVPYAGKLKLDFSSFRPLEEQGRDLPLHKRNDLLHVDAFPTRPTRGGRILRVFLNINPAAPRIWRVGEPFHQLFPKLAQGQKLGPPSRSAVGRVFTRLAGSLGLATRNRSRYDEFMLYLHDWLKENTGFQQTSARQELSFPSGSCWMVYTDGVPHAVMSGQFALEQTFIVPPEALVTPEAAPVRVLESVTGMSMAS